MTTRTLLGGAAALAAALFMSIGAPADAAGLSYAKASGGFTLDGKTAITISVNGTVVSSPGAAPQVIGSAAMAGQSGGVSVAFTAYIEAISFSKVLVNGVSSKHASVQTKPFWYTDPTTRVKRLCYAQIELTQYGAHGRVGFQLIDAGATQRVMASPGEVALSVGSVALLF